MYSEKVYNLIKKILKSNGILVTSLNELSVTKIASSQKDFIFLSPERAATYQPRATPWVNGRLVFSPERALHKKSDKKTCLIFTQGAALGWYVAALSGLEKQYPTL
jgi:hypothetical protein